MSKNPSDPIYEESCSAASPILLSFRTGQQPGEEPVAELADRPITLHAAIRPTRKRLGEAAEAAFVARATRLGFRVLLPWGESNPYDAAFDLGRKWLRIQVKSASSLSDGGYTVKTTGCNGHVYTLDEVDFVAGYVIPENVWYIIPLEAVGGRATIKFRPHSVREPKPMFERYREAWCLLVCARNQRGWHDVPTVCRTTELSVQCSLCPLRK
jgi:hypothetical protein